MWWTIRVRGPFDAHGQTIADCFYALSEINLVSGRYQEAQFCMLNCVHIPHCVVQWFDTDDHQMQELVNVPFGGF